MVEGRQAGRPVGARGTHPSTTALGPRPGVLTLLLVAANLEPRTKPGSRSSRLEESGAAGRWGCAVRGCG